MGSDKHSLTMDRRRLRSLGRSISAKSLIWIVPIREETEILVSEML